MRVLLDDLPAEVVEKLRSRMVRRSWRHGDTIVFQGDPGAGIYFIQSGHVAVKIGTPHGESVTVTVLTAGDSFGELALLHPDHARTATVEALTPTTTLLLSERDFDELRTAYPSIDRAIVNALALRIADLSDQLARVVFETADRRCLRRVLELAVLFADSGADSATIPLTQEDVAGLTGATRPTVNQVLSRMAAERLITLGRGRIDVPSIRALRVYVR